MSQAASSATRPALEGMKKSLPFAKTVEWKNGELYINGQSLNGLPIADWRISDTSPHILEVKLIWILQ